MTFAHGRAATAGFELAVGIKTFIISAEAGDRASVQVGRAKSFTRFVAGCASVVLTGLIRRLSVWWAGGSRIMIASIKGFVPSPVLVALRGMVVARGEIARNATPLFFLPIMSGRRAFSVLGRSRGYFGSSLWQAAVFRFPPAIIHEKKKTRLKRNMRT